MAKENFQRTKVHGFRVEILGGKAGTDADSAWESCTGGGIVLQADPRSATHETTPGHKYVDTVTLRGNLSAGRKAMLEWINATVEGKNQRRNVVIVELTKKGTGKSYVYEDCLLTGLEFPSLSEGSADVLTETATFKPTRLTVT